MAVLLLIMTPILLTRYFPTPTCSHKATTRSLFRSDACIFNQQSCGGCAIVRTLPNSSWQLLKIPRAIFLQEDLVATWYVCTSGTSKLRWSGDDGSEGLAMVGFAGLVHHASHDNWTQSVWTTKSRKVEGEQNKKVFAHRRCTESFRLQRQDPISRDHANVCSVTYLNVVLRSGLCPYQEDVLMLTPLSKRPRRERKTARDLIMVPTMSYYD